MRFCCIVNETQSDMSADHQQPGDKASRNESAYYTAVKRIMSQLSPSTLRQFHQLATDDDRFSFVRALSGVQDALTTSGRLFVDDRTCGKSSEEASRRRQKGNDLYKAEQLKEALDSYTASLMVAPVTDCHDDDDDEGTTESAGNEDTQKTNLEFVLALGNRSACLLQTKRYEDSLADVQLALRYGYPRHLRYKLYDRQARALIELGRYDEAVGALRRLLSSLSLAELDPDRRSSIERNAEKKMDFCSSAVVQPPSVAKDPSTNEKDAASPPTISGRDSDRFPGASDALDVRYHQDKGRYGVASHDVGVGEVLLVESPYVSVLSADACEVRCYNCFKTVGDVPLGCHVCSRVRYV